jgi:hypothetical protein
MAESNWRDGTANWSEKRFDQRIRELFEEIGYAVARDDRRAEVALRESVKELIAERDRRYPYPAT